MKMITITVTNETERQFADDAMSREIMENINLNGADYRVVIGDFCSIDSTVKNFYPESLMSVVFKQDSEF